MIHLKKIFINSISIVVLYSLSFLVSFGQDTLINLLDSQGKKQGYWEKKYPNGKPVYQGYFLNDKPIGEMRRYFENGSLMAVLSYHQNSPRIDAKLFYDNGVLAGEGFYINKDKDSTWRYYSYYTKVITGEETYLNGKLQGASKKYYENGALSEIIEWKTGIKDGKWIQYYDDGKKKLEAQYINDKLEGSFTVYKPYGGIDVKGNYKDNLQDGYWTTYDDKGLAITSIKFINGEPENKEQITKQQEEFFKKIDEGKGKYTEPYDSDMMGPGGK
jgi:antitoxin component YwqK of YwqJK toxin-antitoxin module